MDHVHSGDPVRLYSDADAHEIVDGSVDLIPPYRDAGEKTTSVRVYLSRLPADWKINTLIHAQIGISSPDEGMYVPLSAVNRLGMQDVVWVQDKNHRHVFHARKVETGIETTDSIQITGGLGLGDKIAENAAYMVDHDSFIQ
jgi:Cu(I)/Ag(I) efflux system membrane fusion protein